MVSQVHTITNMSLMADGPVRGLPGYNPLFTVPVHRYSTGHSLFQRIVIIQNLSQIWNWRVVEAISPEGYWCVLCLQHRFITSCRNSGWDNFLCWVEPI